MPRPAPPETPPAAPVRRSPSDRRLVPVGIVLIAGMLAATLWLIISQRAADLARNEAEITNLAQVLAEQTSRTLQPVDLTLRELQARITAPLGGPSDLSVDPGSKATFDLMVERLKGLPQVDAFVITDATGQVVNISRGYPPRMLDLSARDPFLYFRAQDDHTLYVSEPVHAYLDGRWTVYLTRRLNGTHGEFAGILEAAVTLSFLEDFYRAVTPANVGVTVLRRDGLVLAHHPRIDTRIGGRLPAHLPWYQLAGGQGGSYRTTGDDGEAPCLVAVRPLREFPLVINVSMAQAVALSDWQWQALWLVAAAVLAASCVVLLLRAFGRQFNQLATQHAQLETSHLQLDVVLDNMSQGLTMYDAEARLMVCNRRFAELYKLTQDQIRPGTPFAAIIEARTAQGTFLAAPPEDYASQTKIRAEAATPFERINELSDGRVIFLHSKPLPTGGWVSTHEDITERRRADDAVAFLAHHDALTELPNRVLFQSRLGEAIALAHGGAPFALLCLDLDRFKVINDTLGHAVGDGLLRIFAQRLSRTVRRGDTVARLGGDEFAIIQLGVTSPDDAARLAERVMAAMGDPLDIDGHRVVAGTSIGIAIAPRDGATSETLLRNADTALYLAKAEGRGTHRRFEPSMEAQVQARLALELHLRNALAAGEFNLHYQPVLDLHSGKVTAFEALVRWNHPQRGMVSPADFIPVAEETGLIIPLGDWVLAKACQDAASWPPDITIAVNLSPMQFKRGALFDSVRQALDNAHLDPARLELEITESVLLQNSDTTLALLHQFRALGIRIALDDFGTGYSSLGYLRRFPFDKIKIDRYFVRDICASTGSAVIVGAIVGIARALGMTTVAEGVETADQLAKVRDQGCAMVQGYLFSRPRPVQDVPDLIRTLSVTERNAVIEVVS
ncbi:MAG TPA: EAL domain-containing protein [Rhodopila sp.]|nr:EAL domain-containing protein [Rhodopila sp.]